jgi:hypothetical protein
LLGGDKNGRNLGLLTFMNVFHNKLTKRRIFVSGDREMRSVQKLAQHLQ